jgi:DNA-binding CsgD family transcriptional regulator
MSKEFDGLMLTSINPFTKRQAELINQFIEGKDLTRAAETLGIAIKTASNHLGGNPKAVNEASRLGAYGLVEKYKGVRPTRFNIIQILLGDVILPYSNQ